MPPPAPTHPSPQTLASSEIGNFPLWLMLIKIIIKGSQPKLKPIIQIQLFSDFESQSDYNNPQFASLKILESLERGNLL